MIRAIAIDDEPLALRVIEAHAKKLDNLELVRTTTNAIEGLLEAQSGNIDLVFLDIQMPSLTGIQFMQILQGKCKIILTTAYTQYALESYEHDVVDYLLKPISFDRFQKAVNKVYSENKVISETISPSQAATHQPDCIFIKTEHKLLKINHSDILYIEGGKDYITVFTKTEKILSLSSLTKLQESLPHPQFLRVHKSYIVALDKIESVERQRIFMGKTVIPIGDTYKDEFFRVVS
jgi:two-component system, LytTR family, response regulator